MTTLEHGLDPNNLPRDYGELIESAGLTIETRWDERDYQGETFMVVRPKDDLSGKVGLLNYGWGSCSGCDRFENASGIEPELLGLRSDLVGSITWFPNASELLAAVNSTAYRRQFYIDDWKMDEFVAAVRARFGGSP